MKSFSKLLPAAFLSLSLISSAQKSSPDSVRESHISIEKFPKNMIINHLDGWGGMAVAINEMPAGTDLKPLLDGLKNNSCQAPHWGYILKGVLRVRYDDGKEVVLKAGDVFYMPPGHTGFVEEDLKIMDFSPENEMKEVIDHIEKKVGGSNQ